LKILPSSAEAHANLGMIWWQKGDADLAIAAYKEALKHDNKMVTAWSGLTSAHIMAGNFSEALEAAKDGVALEENFPMGQNNLAVALFYTKDFPGAKAAAEKAQELGFPVDPRFFEAINKEI
jgi:tetratricopeptide (TPR) repeat protein